jgi:hypothetical protein
MARRINIGQIGSFCEGQMNQLMRVVVLETDAELKSQSPVDTGRFRASWVIGENSTGNYDAGAQQAATGANRGKTSPPASPAPTLPAGINYTTWQLNVLEIHIHVHNSLPYAEPLGLSKLVYSDQAPAGWVDIIARQMTNRVRQLADNHWEARLMAALDLNAIRAIVEGRLATELAIPRQSFQWCSTTWHTRPRRAAHGCNAPSVLATTTTSPWEARLAPATASSVSSL